VAKLRVFLADDHPVVREGLKALVSAQPDMELAGEAADGRTACDLVAAAPPDVVILDVSMPGLDGVGAAERLRSECPQVKVLALTFHEDPAYLRRLFEAGAAGYVLKRSAGEDLVRAVRAVAAGGVYVDPALTGRLVGGFLGAADRRPGTAPLSEREAEVVRLIAAGHSNKEIAGRLEVSVKTVETYKARAFEKLGLSSRAELVRHAVRQGWLGTE
jgi:DNA-binding NarL/FixJ family response regulator